MRGVLLLSFFFLHLRARTGGKKNERITITETSRAMLRAMLLELCRWHCLNARSRTARACELIEDALVCARALHRVDTCAICLEKHAGADCVVVLRCAHAFHGTCVERMRLRECPTCRAPYEFVATTSALARAPARKLARNLLHASACALDAVKHNNTSSACTWLAVLRSKIKPAHEEHRALRRGALLIALASMLSTSALARAACAYAACLMCGRAGAYAVCLMCGVVGAAAYDAARTRPSLARHARA